METEGVKNISVLKIFDYLMLHDPPNWPSVQCTVRDKEEEGKKHAVTTEFVLTLIC